MRKVPAPEAIPDLEEGQSFTPTAAKKLERRRLCNCNGKKSWISDEGEGKGKTSLADEEGGWQERG
jgi:hypothetical protein